MSSGNVNLGIASAFPELLRDDAIRAVSVLPEPSHSCGTAFRAVVEGEVVTVPYRVYHDTELIDTDPLTSVQREIISCVLTRHHNGFVRQEHLTRILACRDCWIPPFVVQLIGEYVVEILSVIQEGRAGLDATLYRSFLNANPAFWATTKRRVVSYWDCYYRRAWMRREDYVGFQLLEYIDSLLLGAK